MADASPKYPGKPVTLACGTTYVVPSLSVASAAALFGKGGKALDVLAGYEGGLPNAEQLEVLLEGVIFEALRRNYREITREQLREEITLGDFGPLLVAVMEQSAFERRGDAPQGAPKA